MNGYVQVDDNHGADEVLRYRRRVWTICCGVLSAGLAFLLFPGGLQARGNGNLNLATFTQNGLPRERLGLQSRFTFGRQQSPTYARLVDKLPHSNREKDEQWEAQQEIIRRRRDKQSTAKYFDSVKSKRTDSYKNWQSSKIKYVEGKDNLEQWKKLNPNGYKAKNEYDEPEGSLPLPVVPFGLPKFDNGERFDLRLPYVDNGYVAEDGLDAWSRFQGLFDGFGKKSGAEAEKAYNERAKAAANKRKSGGGLFGFGKKVEDEPEPPPPEKKGWFR